MKRLVGLTLQSQEMAARFAGAPWQSTLSRAIISLGCVSGCDTSATRSASRGRYHVRCFVCRALSSVCCLSW